MRAGWADHVPGSCEIPGCPHRVFSRGWCSKHYSRWWRNGSPHLFRPGGGKEMIDEREGKVGTLLDDPDFWKKASGRS